MAPWNSVETETRWLGSLIDEKQSNDYTVLVMAFITVTLLLLTEAMRRGLDRAAHGRKIAETVLEVVYRELTSLGIVSAVLYLIHIYSAKPLNAKAEKLFEDIHYVLFFVAIINAIQCCVLYYLAMRVADKNWVQVENIDIDHYVAIRQRFIKVCSELKEKVSLSSRRPLQTSSIPTLLNQGILTTFKKNLYDFFSHPRLLFKYRKLLVQIRYHELRVKLIEAHKLPPKFRVSEYLMECLNHVFISFIEISAAVWLSLLGVVNLLYFLCGIITFQTQALSAAGSMLAFIYIFHPFVFIIITVFIYAKVKRVFRQIIFSPTLSRHGSFRMENYETNRIDETERNQQLALFWGKNPMYIVAAAQYMLFSSATILSIWLIFQNDDLRFFTDLDKPILYFIIFCVVGSVIFIILWSYVIPAYTLCTGLGALVDVERLYESKALYQLDLLRKERLIMNAKAKEQSELKAQVAIRKFRRGSIWKSGELASSFHLAKISELVKATNDDLEIEISELVKATNDDLEIERRKCQHDSSSLRKTVSEGVGAMRLMTNESSEESLLSRSILAPLSEVKPVEFKRSYTFDHRIRSSGIQQTKLHPPLASAKLSVSHPHEEKSSIDHDGGHVVESSSDSSRRPNPFCNQMSKTINSTAYYIASGFLATSIVFFVVGMRIELFLINDCVLNKNYSWELDPQAAFWIEVSMLLCFVVEASLVTVVYSRTNFIRYISVSISEIVLAGGCLIILLVSESRRCGVTPQSNCANQLDAFCCPAFGKRICGGLGQLEPFTALIGLRACSWLVVRPILNRSEVNQNIESGKSSVDTSTAQKPRTFCRNEGKMIDLWKKAVIAFPDIVERHGLFSSELLEAMLDIPPLSPNDMSSSGNNFQETLTKSFYGKPQDGIGALMETSDNFDPFEDTFSPITELDATLIRVMRRCQQKLLPLLDEWFIADIILTDSEIIWFDVTAPVSTNRFNLRLSRTHGGYGMRVSEVSRGRTVIGRLSLRDIKAISIEHRLPTQNTDGMIANKVSTEEADIGMSDAAFQMEFWEETLEKESSFSPTTKRWERVAYDMLVIHSDRGTLVLRFLVDLLDGEEAITKRSIQDHDIQNESILGSRHEASVWCDTISKKIGKTPIPSSSGNAMMATFRKTLAFNRGLGS